jgi:2-polyprenyl-3-methyl-5-hydroxy-6-metoxy-1,4-benzoquinol methylase
MNNADRTMVETQCLFCGDAESKILFPELLFEESFTGYAFSARRERKREHYRIVKCNKCSLVRSSPILDENSINKLYAESGFIFSDEAPYAAETYIQLAQKLSNKYGVKVKSLLEVGCSTGFFLEKAVEAGIGQVVGFEPSLECYEHASKNIKGQIINDIFTTDVLKGKSFDMACTFQVIDHLKNPGKTIADMMEILNPGGLILIVCHDVESWSAKALKENSPIFDVEHIYLFSKKTIGKLFEQQGMEVLETGSLANTYPLSYWMRMLPVANKLVKILPGFIKSMPVGLNAGNLYIIGRKPVA